MEVSYEWVVILENEGQVEALGSWHTNIENLQGRAIESNILRQLCGNHETVKWNLTVCVSAGQFSTVRGQTNSESEKKSALRLLWKLHGREFLLKMILSCCGYTCHTFKFLVLCSKTCSDTFSMWVNMCVLWVLAEYIWTILILISVL